MNYREALIHSMTEPELVANYDRMLGHQLGECLKQAAKQNFNHQIDVATGRFSEELALFEAFFVECIWSRLPLEKTEVS